MDLTSTNCYSERCRATLHFQKNRFFYERGTPVPTPCWDESQMSMKSSAVRGQDSEQKSVEAVSETNQYVMHISAQSLAPACISALAPPRAGVPEHPNTLIPEFPKFSTTKHWKPPHGGRCSGKQGYVVSGVGSYTRRMVLGEVSSLVAEQGPPSAR